MKFSDLEVGQQFRFLSEVTMPNSGFARGPWVKISSRKYDHLTDAKLSNVRVGSVSVEVMEDGHEHQWGPLEQSRLAGTWHRKCQVAGCNVINALDDDEEGL